MSDCTSDTLRALFDELDDTYGFLASRTRKRGYEHAAAWEADIDRCEALEKENSRLRDVLPVERPHPLDTIAALRKRLEEARWLLTRSVFMGKDADEESGQYWERRKAWLAASLLPLESET